MGGMKGAGRKKQAERGSVGAVEAVEALQAAFNKDERKAPQKRAPRTAEWLSLHEKILGAILAAGYVYDDELTANLVDYVIALREVDSKAWTDPAGWVNDQIETAVRDGLKNKRKIADYAPLGGKFIDPNFDKDIASRTSYIDDPNEDYVEETAAFRAAAQEEGFSVADFRTIIDNAKKAAKGEVTGRANTARANEPPRPDWIEARKRGVKLADLLAQFIRAKFADELADGTMSTQKLYRYEGLHRAFYNHKDKLPPDLQDMPTRSEVYDRMVAEGQVTPAEAVRSAERDRKRIAAARSRGVAVRAAS